MTQGTKLIGMMECRFEPLHKGHVFLVMMAYELLKSVAYMTRGGVDFTLYVIVTSHDGEILPGRERFKWAQQTFGGYDNIVVLHAHNSLEYVAGYGSDYEGAAYKSDWGFWGNVAMEQCGLGDTIDYVYGSEDYVHGIAAACGAKPVLIDQDRDTITVSGTIMRNSPYNNWEYFPDAVKSFFAKKVCIIGGPYPGKKALAGALSRHYHTPLIGDVSDAVYDPDTRGCTVQDLLKIARLHTVRAEALLHQANKVAISDSDTLLTSLWFEEKFGGPMPEWMYRQANTKRFDLYVFTESEGREFRPSNTFQDEDSWHRFSEKIMYALDNLGWPYVCVSGPLDRQVSKAVVAIDYMQWHAEGRGRVGWVPGTQTNAGYST
jgi:HTH-type transcriptional repressor of NAD biosynthesis genes